jgi:hypothetical protein
MAKKNKPDKLTQVVTIRTCVEWVQISVRALIKLRSLLAFLSHSKQVLEYIRFEVFTAVTMKHSIFWDEKPCRSCVERVASIFRVDKTVSGEPARAGGCSHARSTRRHIPEDGILQVLE